MADADRKASPPATTDEIERKPLELNKDTVSDMEPSKENAEGVRGGMEACSGIRRLDG